MNDEPQERKEPRAGPEVSRLQSRLDEMSAAIEALARKAGDLQLDARTRLRTSVNDLRADQERLQLWLNEARTRSNRAWAEGRLEAERRWTEVENRLQSTAREFGAEREATMARAGALLKTWQDTASAYAGRTANMLKEGREDMDRVLDDLRARQREVQRELNELGKVSVGAWARVAKGFEGAWQELDTALRTALGEFERKRAPARAARRSTTATGRRTSKPARPAAKRSSAKTGTAKSTASKAGTAKSRAAKSGAAKSRTAKSTAAKSGSAKSRAAKSGSAKSRSAKSGAAKSRTAKSATSRTGAAKPRTAKRASSGSRAKPAAKSAAKGRAGTRTKAAAKPKSATKSTAKPKSAARSKSAAKPRASAKTPARSKSSSASKAKAPAKSRGQAKSRTAAKPKAAAKTKSPARKPAAKKPAARRAASKPRA